MYGKNIKFEIRLFLMTYVYFIEINKKIGKKRDLLTRQ